MQANQHVGFSGKIGYIMAVAGSAVGLGNIWRFPYLTAKYGGGMFLLTYIILAVTFGYTLVMAETAIGRKTGKSAIAAFSDMSKKHKWMGMINGIIPVLIIPYYCVIGGWVLKYFYVFAKGEEKHATMDGYFDNYISQMTQPVLFTILFVALVLFFVLFGVKGIEKTSKLLMPVLALLSVVIAVYSITRPGAGAGIRYYLIPDFSHFSIMTVVVALGQMFYSLSIAMGILFAYGSYMSKDLDMESSIRQIEIVDLAIAFIAGLMIIPAIFSFSGGDASILSAGPGLMFVTLPKVFYSMPFGRVIGGLFFLLVFFAALTSAISLMEASIRVFMDQFHMKRDVSCLVMGMITIFIGLVCSFGFGIWDHVTLLGLGILDFFDFITNSILMPIAALCTCFFITHVIGISSIVEEIKISSAFKREKMFIIVIRYLAPVCLIAILLSSIFSTFGFISY